MAFSLHSCTPTSLLDRTFPCLAPQRRRHRKVHILAQGSAADPRLAGRTASGNRWRSASRRCKTVSVDGAMPLPKMRRRTHSAKRQRSEKRASSRAVTRSFGLRKSHSSSTSCKSVFKKMHTGSAATRCAVYQQLRNSSVTPASPPFLGLENGPILNTGNEQTLRSAVLRPFGYVN